MEHRQPPNKKGKTIFSFFEKKKKRNNEQSNVDSSIPDLQTPSMSHVAELMELDIKWDPGLRKQICEYPVNQCDVIRRAYINYGPYQPILAEYSNSVVGKQNLRFQYIWLNNSHGQSTLLPKIRRIVFHAFSLIKQISRSAVLHLSAMDLDTCRR